MVRIFTLLILALAVVPVQAQPTAPWQTLTGVPTSSRYNDAYFVSPERGWVVNGTAYVYRTTDGGATWTQQFHQDASHLRSVAFLDSLRGFIGNVGVGEFGTTDPTNLYGTEDGGRTWRPVTTISGPEPKGLCGMFVVNDSVIVAVGRVRGPAFFVKTVDGGRTWQSQDLSAHAAGLIDVYFPHPDTGFVAGLTSSDHARSSGVLLATTDGGRTWERRFVSTRTGEWFWKFSFPSRQVGYASLQRNTLAPIYFVKTTDGGRTWEEKLFSKTHYFVQGMGFVNERTGWIGGNSTHPAYQTTDGGDTWTPTEIGARLNRFRFLNDTLGYAVGTRVHKLTVHTATSVATPPGPWPGLQLEPGYPNPFDRETTIPYALPTPMPVSIDVYDVRGRRVRTLAAGHRAAGRHVVTWDGTDDEERRVAAGIYFCVVRAGETVQTRPLFLLQTDR